MPTNTQVTAFTPIGDSQVMQDLKRMVEFYRNYNSDLLILGETGTGKEVFARYFHSVCSIGDAPFVALNCGEMEHSDTLIAKVFGHSRNAFTGATCERKGAFEAAGEGILFLDEIGNAPRELQRMLLRALQEREGSRMGEDKVRKYTCRVVSATNKDLRVQVAGGQFMHDLYHRLAGTVLELPPLREHPEDIPQLAVHLLTKLVADGRCPPCEISTESLEWLSAQYWGGNVRELENVLRGAACRPNSTLIDVPTLIGLYEGRRLEGLSSDSGVDTPGPVKFEALDDPRSRVLGAVKDPKNRNTRGKPVFRRIADATGLDPRTVKKYLCEGSKKSLE